MALNDMTAVGLIAVAAALFRFGWSEFHKSKKRRKARWATLAILLSLSYFGWLIFVHGARAAAMLAVANWKLLAAGVVLVLLGCYLLFGPKARRKPQIGLRFISMGAMFILMGLGLLAGYLWQAAPAAKFLLLGH